MVLQWSQQTVVGPHRIAIYKSVKKHSATEQMSQTQAQLVKGFSNTSASADVITVDSSANVGINETSPVKDLDVTGEIRASTGILFGTDTAAANTLDDYEEGTWTAGIIGTTTAGSYTFSKDTGNYTKIGNLVKVDLWLDDINTVSAGSGQARITGLPFPVKTGDNQYHGAVRLSDWNVDSLTVSLAAAALAVSDQIGFIETRDATSAASVNITDKSSNNAYVMLSLTYMAA